MSATVQIWKTSIGRKIMMAATGVVLILFLLGHMIGNLQILLGPEPINRYAAFLQGLGELLWAIRLSMVTIFIVHIVLSIWLTLENWSARPVPYQKLETVQASLASRTMIWTGILVAGFLIMHIMHYTMGVLQPEHFHHIDAEGRHDVYAMLVHGFSNIGFSGLYIVLMIMLGTHLSHAISSACETLGFNHPGYAALVKYGVPILSWGIAIGYIIVPVSVLCGIVTLPVGGN